MAFEFRGKRYPAGLEALFYDYLYCQAVKESMLVQELRLIMGFDYFTDIEFNPNKSVNCQARSITIIKAMLQMYGEIPDISRFADFKRFYYALEVDKAI